MKNTMYRNEFIDGMNDVRPDNFTYQGLIALYNYFDELEEDCGIEIEFDPIAFCCEYTEDSIENIAANYSIDLELSTEEVIEYLQERTTVIDLGNGDIIIQDY